jgi:hypothetical protein
MGQQCLLGWASSAHFILPLPVTIATISTDSNGNEMQKLVNI